MSYTVRYVLGGAAMVLRALVVLPIVALVAACSAESEDGATTDAPELTTHTIEALAGNAPEPRIVTSPVTAILGAPLAATSRVVAIRTLRFDGKPARFVVDVDSFATALVDAAQLAAGSRAAGADDRIADAAYPRSLASLAASLDALEAVDEDAAVPAGASEPFALTIDMCQSSKPFEKRLFDWAESLSGELGHPVPVGIAMSGGWLKAHGGELATILGYEQRGKIRITWINHSSTHPLHCLNASCSSAEFLTAASVDMNEEVLGLERALLARGLVPSPIFRFPGLVHDAQRMKQLASLSLMPIDADAWIAKGQPIRSHAVVLVHGNGNEPEGITGFLKAAGTRAGALASGKSVLVDPISIAPTPPRAAN